MLYGVSHARYTIFVTEVSHVDVERSTSLVGIWVMDKQRLELVLQANDAVITIVQRRLLHVLCQDDGGSLATRHWPR